MGQLLGVLFFGAFAAAGLWIGFTEILKPILFWVENDRWQESPIEIAFASVFLITHAGLGLGGLAAILTYKDERTDTNNQDDGKPWLSKTYWAEQTINAETKFGARPLIYIASYLLSVGAISAFASYQAYLYEDSNAIKGLIIPALAILISYGFYVSHQRFLQYGVGNMHLDPYPASIGGQLGGRIQLSHVSNEIESSILRIRCTKYYQGSDGEESDLIWDDEMVPAWSHGYKFSEAVFCFDLLDGTGLPVSEPKEWTTRKNWSARLIVKLKNGTKIKRDYKNIPVFRTGQDSRISALQAQANQSKATRRMHDEAVSIALPFESVDSSVYAVHYPMLRSYWWIFYLLFGAMFAWAGLATKGEWFFWGLFLGIGAWALTYGVYSLANSLSVVVSPQGITNRRYVFGIPIKSRFIAASELSRYSYKESYSMSGTESVSYYTVYANARGGAKLVVAEDIKGRAVAAAALKKLETYLVPVSK